ncbi:MAG: hypothetical protein U5L00_21350 [Desulfovermiculus sp.]|nr:hypothetical protein [Desulfovermiculus sp.]
MIFAYLPGDFHGLEFKAYSRSFTQTSLKHKAEDMGLWWPLDTIFAQAAWAHMLGDEQPSSETLQTISMLQNSSLPVFQTAGSYLDVIWTDLPPADNDCLVFFPWNMHNSFDVLCSLLKQLKFIQPSALPPANLTYLLGQSAQKTFCRIDQ